MNKIEFIFNYLDTLIPDPKCELEFSKDYELVIAVMLSAQSTDKSVNRCTRVLFNKYPSIDLLKEADIEDIKSIIRPIGMESKKAKNIVSICNKLDDIIPNDREFLESLDGIGRKSTNVILGMLYNEPCIAVDTHIFRVSKRLGLANDKDNVLKVEKKLTSLLKKDNMIRYHQQLLLFGRYYCKAIRPECIDCGLIDICNEKKKSI